MYIATISFSDFEQHNIVYPWGIINKFSMYVDMYSLNDVIMINRKSN